MTIKVKWYLFDHKAAPAAEATLNARLNDLLAKYPFRTEKNARRIRDAMYRLMDKYERLGARDTEPETELVIAIEKALRLPENTLTR